MPFQWPHNSLSYWAFWETVNDEQIISCTVLNHFKWTPGNPGTNAILPRSFPAVKTKNGSATDLCEESKYS